MEPEGSSNGGGAAAEDGGAAAAMAEARQAALEEMMEMEARMGGGGPPPPGAGGPGGDGGGGPSNALHGLLRKLGAGLDELLPSAAMTASRMKAIMTGLKADDDGRQLAALSELCELLSLGTEESMGALSVDSIAPLLVQQLRKEHNPDLMLLASRALCHMIDALPSSGAVIVHCDAVPLFCERLICIEYIDLAEQSLQVTRLPAPPRRRPPAPRPARSPARRAAARAPPAAASAAALPGGDSARPPPARACASTPRLVYGPRSSTEGKAHSVLSLRLAMVS